MIETKWEISEYNSTTGLFENPVSILAPNNQFNIPLKSTRTIEDIVDGDIVMVKPEKHTKKGMITFNWEFTEKTDIKDIIQGYIRNDKAVKISMNPDGSSYDADFYGLSDQSIEGYFMDCDPQPVIGIEGNKQIYQFKAMFQPFEVS
jgi:hypothetical protein